MIGKAEREPAPGERSKCEPDKQQYCYLLAVITIALLVGEHCGADEYRASDLHWLPVNGASDTEGRGIRTG